MYVQASGNGAFDAIETVIALAQLRFHIMNRAGFAEVPPNTGKTISSFLSVNP